MKKYLIALIILALPLTAFAASKVMFNGVVIKSGTFVNPSPYNKYFVNNNGLVGWWGMDEGVGSTTADLSGNGNTGTWGGTPGGTSGYYSAGKVGNWAGYFNGSNDYIGVSDSASLNPVSAITFSFWIDITSTSTPDGYITILDKNDVTGYMPRLVGCTIAGCTLDIEMAGTFHRLTAGTVPLNTWTLCAMTYNGTIITNYINGVAVASNSFSASISAAGSPLYIGYRLSGSTEYFTGMMDDIRIYNRALSAAEIAALYGYEKSNYQ